MTIDEIGYDNVILLVRISQTMRRSCDIYDLNGWVHICGIDIPSRF